MPRPVCGLCQLEMNLTRSVVVQFNAKATGGAYQQWHADEAECPGCGRFVVTRYATHPSWEHFQGVATREQADYEVEER